MPAQLVRRTYHWVRVDWVSVVGYPLLAVTLMSLIGITAKGVFPLFGWYYTPYAIIIAACANRVCVRAGVVAALLSALSHSWIFVPPAWAFELPTPEQALTYLSGVVLALIVGRKIVHETAVVSRAVGMGEALPFVDKTDKKRTFWAVEPSGQWADDAAVGASYAEVWLHRLNAGTAPPLGWIIRDMVKKGRWTGVEAGFIRMISGVRSGRPNHNA